MAVSTDTPTAEFARLNFRLPQTTKEIIERAALASGLTVTDFAISAMLQSAHETLDRHAQRLLSDRDRDHFLALLDREVEPNEALKNAARRFKRLRGKK